MSYGATLLALLRWQMPPEPQLQFVIFRRVLKVVTKHPDTGELMCRETNQRKFLMGECFDVREDAVFLARSTITCVLIVFRLM